MNMSSFFDVLNQELFVGAIVVLPSTLTRNYYDYGVVEQIYQFSFNLSIIRAEETFLPEGTIPVKFTSDSVTSALGRGVLIIHPDILIHSNMVNPRYWKKLILNHSLMKIHPKS
jgi:hypothetical protein